MHAYTLVSLESTRNPEVNAERATNEVLEFFVCCATFVLSVCLLFFQRGVGFFQAMSFSTPCEKFEFITITSKV